MYLLILAHLLFLIPFSFSPFGPLTRDIYILSPNPNLIPTPFSYPQSPRRLVAVAARASGWRLWRLHGWRRRTGAGGIARRTAQAVTHDGVGGDARRWRHRTTAVVAHGVGRPDRYPSSMPVPDGHAHGHRILPDRPCGHGSGTGTWVSGRAWNRSTRAQPDPLPSLPSMEVAAAVPTDGEGFGWAGL
uniref:Uncharacterized protein n=1 Tax=Oryza sativa subsp. japonica TaxID=39947 RepID=Q6K2K8_ORYSJ|nr:hypothetical protein [Oryza sativa Japonica Group]BAD22464.1 hypothetical protein [Oryza sativa Japonica Group]